jgi:hypothetical protein
MRCVRQEHASQKTWRSAHTCPMCCDNIPPIFLTAPPSYEPMTCHLRQCEKRLRDGNLATSASIISVQQSREIYNIYYHLMMIFASRSRSRLGPRGLAPTGLRGAPGRAARYPSIFAPASMWIAEPVIAPARSEHRNATAKASSSGRGWRLIGCMARARWALYSGVTPGCVS